MIEIKEICDALDNLANEIQDGWTDDRTLNAVRGWNFVPLNRYDLALIPKRISSELKKLDLSKVEISDVQVKEVLERIEEFKNRTLPYVFSGNGNQAVPVFMSLMQWIKSGLAPLHSWETLYDNNALPSGLTKKLTTIQTELEDVLNEKKQLEEKIKVINDAYEAAESLPTNIITLKKAQKTINEIQKSSSESKGVIDSTLKESKKLYDNIYDYEVDTSLLVDKCEQAYRITTTKGLAASFEQRAIRTHISMYVWVFALIGALVGGMYIGSVRFEFLLEALNKEEPSWSVIGMHCLIALLSISAPVWFAWISTKQLSQRFRLAEDYSFKASVAKAYEGYRKEASRIDPALEARLFSSALTRLEEAPLRLMESHSHGSPFHELISSSSFQKALQLVPELKDKFIEVVENKLPKLNTDNNKKNNQN